MAEKTTRIVPRERRGLARREPFAPLGSPFRMLERFADEMDRVFVTSGSVGVGSLHDGVAAG